MFRVLYQIRNPAVPITISTKYLSQSSNSIIVGNRSVDENVNQNNRISREPNKNISWDEAKPFESIPGPKPMPIIGNIWRFLPIIGEYYNMPIKELHSLWHQQFGDIMILKGTPGIDKLIFSFNPEDFETIFRNDGIWPIRNAFGSFTSYRLKYVDFANPGLLAQHGQEWGKVRSITNTAMMQPRVVNNYIPYMEKVADDFIKRIDILIKNNRNSELPDDFINELNKWGLESICLVALDIRLGSFDPKKSSDPMIQKLIDYVNEMFSLIYKLDMLPSLYKYYSTRNWQRFVKIMHYITSVCRRYIDEALERMENNNSSSEGNLSVLEQLLKKDKSIAYGMAMDMIVAGIDTTSKTMATTLYYLAINQAAQDKLREEIYKVLPNSTSVLNERSIDSMPYLRAVIKECQRMAPIAIGLQRCSQKNFVLSGYRVPAGTEIVTSNLILGLSEKNFVHADQYIPERWLRGCPKELTAKNANPFVCMPFGHGPRACVGKRIALSEIEILLTKLLRKYKLDWKYGEMKFSNHLVYGVDSPLKFQLSLV